MIFLHYRLDLNLVRINVEKHLNAYFRDVFLVTLLFNYLIILL